MSTTAYRLHSGVLGGTGWYVEALDRSAAEPIGVALSAAGVGHRRLPPGPFYFVPNVLGDKDNTRTAIEAVLGPSASVSDR